MSLNTIEELNETLKDPGKEYRSAPFWGWNDKLDPAELKRQLADFKEKGMGGTFVHSREGLETPYLSEEWMQDVDLSVREAQKDDLELWVYDEDKWPSGSAGGTVSAADPDAFTAKGLTLEVLTGDAELPAEEPSGVRLIGVYAAETDGNRLLTLGTGSRKIVLRREISGPSEWYNNFAPPDNLNPDAVREFIRLTHEKYLARFGAEFGKTIKGFFTDEPDVCDFYCAFTSGRPWLPWTDRFPAYFEEKRGYSVLEKLPYLFFTGEGCEKVRHDYWRTVSELFSEAYMKQLYDFCEAHGLESSGHILYENDMGYGIRVCGSAMPQYRYLHRPGIDILGEQAREYLTVKQCSSVANQYGRENTISETYGTTGWQFTFEGQKWLGDWQFVNGITRRCQHLALYSVTGCRKRDYPPVFNYQNTWWEYNKQMEDYFARLTACVQAGSVVRDILVLHPVSSLWTMCGSDPGEDLGRVEMNMGWTDRHIMRLNELGNTYNRLAETLVRNHLDFDFGDEIIMAENAAVEGNLLRIGRCRYSVVAVPQVCSLFASTVKLLEEFAAAGGKIIWTGELPQMVEGTPDDRVNALVGMITRVPDYDALLRELDRTARNISAEAVTGGECTDILTMLRRTEDGYVLTAVNNDRNDSRFVRFSLGTVGAVTAYDPWTGSSRELTCEVCNGAVTFADTLSPAGSCVYLLSETKQPRAGRVTLPYEHPHRTEPVFAVLGPSAPVRRTAPNALTLDRCSWQLGTDAWNAETDVWQAQRAIRTALGMQQVYYNGAPQRYSWLCKPQTEGRPFALRFTFCVKDVPETACRLAVEKPAGLMLTCNGETCALTEEWYSDRATCCFTLPQLRVGENELILSGLYTAERELEDVFLLGDFAVDDTRALTRETGRLHFGDWCFQGYPHYSGGMVYTFRAPARRPDGKRITLHLGAYRAAVAEIFVNGTSAGLLFGRCRDAVDITDLLRDTENTVEIKLTATPRNLYGPFHQAYTGCSRISWADFRTEGDTYCADYVLEPYGLMGQITLTATDKN